jgi:hypothetical protein
VGCRGADRGGGRGEDRTEIRPVYIPPEAG